MGNIYILKFKKKIGYIFSFSYSFFQRTTFDFRSCKKMLVPKKSLYTTEFFEARIADEIGDNVFGSLAETRVVTVGLLKGVNSYPGRHCKKP